MGGSKTVTYKDLQVQKLMDDPEKAYKASMREAYKNVGAGMRAVIREYQQGIVDTRSLFNDSYLTNLGYNPSETIKYKVVDPILVLSWLKTNVNTNISKVVDYKWGVPSLEEIAIEYLQDTYSGMVLADKSFLISGVRWYVSGVTNVSTTMTNATCYKDRNVTAQEYATANKVVVSSIEDGMHTIGGVNYWKVTLTTGVVVNVPVKYTTIECPGVGSDVVQAIIAEYNGKEYPVQGEYNPETDTYMWTNAVKVSVYIDSDGSVKVTGTASRPTYSRFNSSRYLESTKEAVANIVDQVEKAIELDLIEELDRLVATYELNGVQKLKLAEIDKGLVSSIANASAYPIIPLRENYAFVKETRQMKVILNKLGMATDDFETSLNNSKIKNAAIMFLIDLEDDSVVGTKVVYETLVNMIRTTVPASGKGLREAYQLDFGFNDVNMKTSVNFVLSTKAGVVAEVGKHVRYIEEVEYTETEEDGREVTRTGKEYGIRKQISESYYEEMEFGRSNTSWKVGGYSLGGERKSIRGRALQARKPNNGEIYIPITDLGLNGLTYEELHYAIARGMSMMALSIVKVKTKWYQSGFFKFVMIAAIAVAAFFTGGAALSAYGPLAAGLVYAGAAVSILGVMGVNTGVVGQIIQVAAVIFGGYVGLTSTTATAGQQTLAVASTLTSLVSIASEINLQGVMDTIADKQKAKQAELEASEVQLKEIADNTQQGLWMGIQDRSPELLYAMSSTEMMCNYDVLYDYDGLIDGQIASVGI